MQTYLVPLTFPDLDTAKRDAPSLLDALKTAGVSAELVGGREFERSSADRPDPGPTRRELHVHADSADDARARVTPVVEGQFPPGMILIGEPTQL